MAKMLDKKVEFVDCWISERNESFVIVQFKLKNTKGNIYGDYMTLLKPDKFGTDEFVDTIGENDNETDVVNSVNFTFTPVQEQFLLDFITHN